MHPRVSLARVALLLALISVLLLAPLVADARRVRRATRGSDASEAQAEKGKEADDEGEAEERDEAEDEADRAKARKEHTPPGPQQTACARTPPLSQQPRFEKASPQRGKRRYTTYATDAKAAAAEVMRVTAGGSFIERVLRVITVDGKSKNFFTMTGLDGLTVGITDFATNSGIAALLSAMHRHRPADFREAFGAHHASVLDAAWLAQNNAGGKKAPADDKGLIRIEWFRVGLSKLLCSRAFFGLQLGNFVRGKAEPSLRMFQEHGLKLEVTLAALIGIANSGGPGMAKGLLSKALRQHAALPAGRERELAVARTVMELYADGDKSKGAHYAERAREVIEAAFSGAELAARPDSLGHRGKRMWYTLKYFPPAQAAEFSGLGRFSLSAGEAFADFPETRAT
jgi:hypothetical protein